MIAFI